jgi:8-oxo-dGTP pyrophosphatase MutT (NUDIX family)
MMRNAGPPRVAAVILHRAGRVLLQHRDADPRIRWPGHWAIFGGHVEEGEEPEAAARREIEEELGLRLEGPLPLVCHRRDPDRERFIFAAPLSVPLSALTLTEGQGLALLAPAELAAYPVVPVHHEILQHFLDAGGA